MNPGDLARPLAGHHSCGTAPGSHRLRWEHAGRATRRGPTVTQYSEELARDGGELDERQTGVRHDVGMEEMPELEDAVGDARRRS